MLHAIIMAGGSGTRFWPASRNATPKQLLQLAGSNTMIQATLERLESVVPADRTLIVTNRRLVKKIADQLPQLPPGAILGEPCKRDTVPCIGLAALQVSQSDPDATMVVMPSDHVIADSDSFASAIRLADDLIEQDPQRLVTFGIPPTYPAESFGYIERGEQLDDPESPADQAVANTFHVRKFHEKPKLDVAREYVQRGGFYWNSGIFVWKAATVLQHLASRVPDMVHRLKLIMAAQGTATFDDVFAEQFAAIKGTSIDYAVMEHAEEVLVIEAPFDWDDVGNWQSLPRLLGKDSDGNTIQAQHIGINTTDSIIRSESGHLVATLGISNCIVVHTPDATLVADRDDEEAIRQLVKLIEQRGWEQFL